MTTGLPLGDLARRAMPVLGTCLLTLICSTAATQAQLYTEGPGVNPPFEDIRDDITNGYAGTVIDVHNGDVEGGLFDGFGIQDDLRLHTLANSSIGQGAHGNWSRWYQTDGATQVFRLFPGEENVRPSSSGVIRPLAARIEAFDRNTGWNVDDGEWHDWVGRYTIVKPIDATIFQAKDTDNDDWSVALGMNSDGGVFVTHRRPMPGQPRHEVLLDNAIGQPFDIRIRDNGLDYEVYFGDQNVPFTSGQYIRNDEPGDDSDTRFRWGMYVGSNPVLDEGMIFVSHASVDPDIDFGNSQPLDLYLHGSMPVGARIHDRTLWYDDPLPGAGTSLAALGRGIPGNTFYVDSYSARTENVNDARLFDATLVLQGTGTELINHTAHFLVTQLDVNDDALFGQRRANQHTSIGILNLNADLLLREQTTFGGSADLTIDEIAGDGVLTFGRNSVDLDNTWGFHAVDANHDFTGTVLLEKGTLKIQADAVELSMATLQILDNDSFSQIDLAHDATFILLQELDADNLSHVTTTILPGTYTARELDTLFGTAGRFTGTGSLTVLGSIPGDYDFDGDVDGDDHLKWQQTFGSTADLMADGNLNGIVDAADFSIWRDNLGATSAVPESHSLLFSWLGLVVALRRRRNPDHREALTRVA
jgi:hypothetical protein